jgi:hypothetical protein
MCGDDNLSQTFDRDDIFGNAEVLMGEPLMLFAEELLDYCPHTKSIVDKSEDRKAWIHERERMRVLTDRWRMWILRLFDSELFWWY